MTLINSLPEDIIIDCISRLPRRYYPTLSLVSKYFRTLITSPELYARRVLLDRTENCVYVTISKSDCNGGDDRLYTLRQSFNSPDKKYSLVPVSSLPRLPPSASYVAVDSKIFVLPNDMSLSSTDTLLIDCRFHTAHHVSSMPVDIGPTLSIYKYTSVGEMNIGERKVGSSMEISDGVVMFMKKPHKSVRNQIPQTLVFMCEWSYDSAMTKDYVSYNNHKAGDILNSKPSYDNECFLDGESYFYSPRLGMLEAFNIRRMGAHTVEGVELMTGEDVNISRTVLYGEKVVVFLQKEFDEKKEIWCAEIKVERDKEGGFCGLVEWCGCVLEGQWLTLNNSLVVKV